MKRFFHSLVFLVLYGCANPVSSNEEYLNELNVEDPESEVVIIPGGTSLTIVDIEDPDLGLVTGEDATYMPCICEWDSWRTGNGLICFGIVCTDSCPQCVIDCNEARRACTIAW